MPKDFKEEYLEAEKRFAAERKAKLSKIGLGDDGEAQSRPRAQSARIPAPAQRPVRQREARVGITESAARPVSQRPAAPSSREMPMQKQKNFVANNSFSNQNVQNPGVHRPSATQTQRPMTRTNEQRPPQRTAQTQRQANPQGRPAPTTRPQNNSVPAYESRRNPASGAQVARPGTPVRHSETPQGRGARHELTDSDIFKKKLSENESRAMMFALTGKAENPSDGGNVDVIDMGRAKRTAQGVRAASENAKKKNRIGRYIGRAAFSVLTALVFVVVAVLSAVFVIAHGPSESARNLAVQMAMQSSGAKWAPGLFLSDDVINQILEDGQNIVQDAVSLDDYSANGGADTAVTEDEWAAAKEGMIFKTVNGSTYKAYVLLVKDPSRVFVGTSTDNFNNATAGVDIFQAVSNFGALAAINAGEFADNGGHGSGYAPLGLTFSKGECVWNDHTTKTFMGFTNDNKLVVRESMTEDEAKELGIRDAVSFQTGNTLIERKDNQVVMYYAEDNTGTSQRTAIGQREDGTVIMIVTDGRTASSLGATHNDMIDMMVSYGAVSAGMLDGGSSAMMYYQDYYTKYSIDTSTLDEYQMRGLVNKYKAFTNPRKIPTFFMVTPE